MIDREEYIRRIFEHGTAVEKVNFLTGCLEISSIKNKAITDAAVELLTKAGVENPLQALYELAEQKAQVTIQ